MKKNIHNEIITEINKIREKGNFQTIKKVIGEDRLKEFINSIYPKFSITEIEKIMGVSDSTLGYWFNKLDIPFIRNHIDTLSIPGDLDSEIVIEKNGKTKKLKTVNVTPDIAYLIGFALGDGTIQKYMVEFFNKDENLKKYIFNLLKPHGSITENIREDGLWRLRLSSVKFANLIKKDKKIREDTINYIFGNDLLTQKFVAAFWDAEGTVHKARHNYYHLYLFNSNTYLMNKIREFLESKNIEFSVRGYEPRESIIKGRLIKPKKIVYRLSIPKSSSLKWAREIGIHLNHSKKRENVKQILEFYGGIIK